MSHKRVVKIGECSVDAGLIFIGDPCYHWEHTSSLKGVVGTSWHDFCHSLPEEQWPQYKDYDGLGVVVGSFGGDGTYPVYAEVVDGTITSVTIYFDGDPLAMPEDDENQLIDNCLHEEGDSDWDYEADDGSAGTAKWTEEG